MILQACFSYIEDGCEYCSHGPPQEQNAVREASNAAPPHCQLLEEPLRTELSEGTAMPGRTDQMPPQTAQAPYKRLPSGILWFDPAIANLKVFHKFVAAAVFSNLAWPT